MQILVISDAWYPQINGVVRTYEGMMPSLQKKGHVLSVIGPADCGLNIPCPQYNEIRLSIGGLFSLASKIDKIRASVPPDQFHLHIATEGPLGWVARRYARRHGLKFSSCYHTEFPDYVAKRVPSFLSSSIKRITEKMIRSFHAEAGTMFVATESLRTRLLNLGYKIPLSPLTRGIDHAVFNTGPKNKYNDFKKPIALYVGRVAVEKNLEAFLSVPWTGQKVIVGDGPDRSYLEKKYSDVLFAGKKQGHDLADHFRSADLFVFPSKTDTFGMVIVEAMACGLPVAAFPVTGPIDIITDSSLGALNDDLSIAMQTAINAPQYAMHRERYAQTHYSWDKVADQFIDGIIRYCPTTQK